MWCPKTSNLMKKSFQMEISSGSLSYTWHKHSFIHCVLVTAGAPSVPTPITTGWRKLDRLCLISSFCETTTKHFRLSVSYIKRQTVTIKRLALLSKLPWEINLQCYSFWRGNWSNTRKKKKLIYQFCTTFAAVYSFCRCSRKSEKAKNTLSIFSKSICWRARKKHRTIEKTINFLPSIQAFIASSWD